MGSKLEEIDSQPSVVINSCKVFKRPARRRGVDRPLPRQAVINRHLAKYPRDIDRRPVGDLGDIFEGTTGCYYISGGPCGLLASGI